MLPSCYISNTLQLHDAFQSRIPKGETKANWLDYLVKVTQDLTAVFAGLTPRLMLNSRLFLSYHLVPKTRITVC